MYRTLAHFVPTITLLCMLAATCQAGALVAHWALDDGSGSGGKSSHARHAARIDEAAFTASRHARSSGMRPGYRTSTAYGVRLLAIGARDAASGQRAQTSCSR